MRFVIPSILVTIGTCTLFVLAVNHFSFDTQQTNWHFPCLSYAPTGQTKDVSAQQQIIREDLKHISEVTSCVRIYSYVYPYNLIPQIATELDFEVIVGVWIEKENEDQTHEQINAIIADHRAGQPFKYIIVGNETTLHNRATQQQLYTFIKSMKDAVDVPVSTAEPSRIWMGDGVSSDIIALIDFLSVNMLSFWYGVPASDAIELVNAEYEILDQLYDKPLVISEVGWPSFGQRQGEAIAGIALQQQVLSDLDSHLAPEIAFYNVIEAYDTPWKMFTVEGLVGAHWGLFTNHRQDKFNGTLIQQLVTLPILLFVLASISITGYFFFVYRTSPRPFPWIALAILTGFQALFLLDAYMLWHLFELYVTINSIQFGTVLFLMTLASILMVWQLFEIFQIERLKHTTPKKHPTPPRPYISIHIPTHTEPPELVIQTIKSCLALSYDHFQIIVVSNNCTDPAVWKPVAEFCATARNVTFLHEDTLPGYKAGALNLALKHTAPEASWIGVVDADYVVQPQWLACATQYMNDDTSVVKMPQHYRSHTGSYLEHLLIIENDLVFKGGNLHVGDFYNASVLHGTMCLIKKDDLTEVGGWSENSVTEDADLGLRMIASNKQIVSIPKVCGSGLAPQNIQALLNQRFRWTFGSTRICIDRKNILFSPKSNLRILQRLHFMFGWMPWFMQGLYPLLVAFCMFKLYDILHEPKDLIPGAFYFIIILIIIIGILRLLYMGRNANVRSVRDIFFVMLLQSALTPTVASAFVFALWKKHIAFKSTHSVHHSLRNNIHTTLKHVCYITLLGYSTYALFTLPQLYSLSDLNVVMFIVFMVTIAFPLLCYYCLYLFTFLKTKRS